MPTIKNRAQLDDVAKPVVDLIEKFGFAWKFITNYPTPGVDREVQIRNESHRGPRQEVIKYAAAMTRGDRLPPIVISRDGYTIDGNTRSRAAVKNRYPTLGALMLDDDWDTDDRRVRERMRALGAAFNLRNGRGIDQEEQDNAIRALAADGTYAPSRIADLLGVPVGRVNAALYVDRAIDRLERLGVSVSDSVGKPQLQELGRAANKLNDKPYEALYSIIRDAGLPTREIRRLTSSVAKSGSDVAALELLAKDRAGRRVQIAEYRASGRSRPSASLELRKHLEWILRHENNPKELAERNQTLIQEHLLLVRRAVWVLGAAAEAQASWA